jgi:hypothetical protein
VYQYSIKRYEVSHQILWEELMLNEDMFNVSLPKWPGHVVVGDKITEDQAKEVLIKTDGFYFSSNDKTFCQQLCKAAGMKWDKWSPVWETVDAARKVYGVLPLHYLSNDQITSSFIGGPHGWCNWSGDLVSYGTNVGKWPSVHEVYNDWVQIAQEFPFLTLKSQLYSDEGCDPSAVPVVEFSIHHGTVEMYAPICPLLPSQVTSSNDMSRYMARMTSPHGERGCTIETFKEALAIAKKTTENKGETRCLS